jgi:hypothetical protein
VGDPDGGYVSRGFDPRAAYLVPDPEQPWGFVTRFHEGTSAPEIHVPPRDARARILMFGGSNTAGFPALRLQTALDQIEKAEAWEVVNLGRSGYGSRRVAILFEQALDLLDPDLAVIYTGHNEFVERGFEMDLGDVATETGWRTLPSRWARRTRLYHAFLDAEAGTRVSPQTRPEKWTWEYEKFQDLHYDETREYFAAFGDNLRAMCAIAADRGVPVVLSTVIYNRFAVPFVSTLPADMDAEQRDRFARLRADIDDLLPTFLAPLLPAEEVQRVHVKDWGRSGEHVDIDDLALPGRRSCVGPFADTDPRFRPEATWQPHIRPLYECLERFHTRDLDEEQRAALRKAEVVLDQALNMSPNHPRTLFDAALVASLLDRDREQVIRRFEDAARFDRAPRKASAAINDIVRQVAAESPGTVFLDSDVLFARFMPDGLTGWEWMVDHCHLSSGARRILMDVFANAISEHWTAAELEKGAG